MNVCNLLVHKTKYWATLSYPFLIDKDILNTFDLKLHERVLAGVSQCDVVPWWCFSAVPIKDFQMRLE